VIEYIEEEQDDECKGIDIYSSKTTTWIYKESKWGPNTYVIIERSEEMRSSETMYLNGCLHIMGTQGFTLRYLLWIWRKRHGGRFLGHVVLHPPSIKLNVTCVYVLFVVAIYPNFQFGSLKTMVLINGH
jgi:hypothetical protein